MKQIPDKIYEKFVLRLKPIRSLLDKTKKVMVCVSGGPDSMFLLLLTYKFSIKNDIKIIPLYINHKVRTKKEIKNDIKTIKLFCKKYNLPLVIKEINPKKFDENTLRELRYKKIVETANKYNCQIVFTGHTQNDLIETFFINLLRGSGIKGLCSISTTREIVNKNKKIYILRPIIDIKKEEILKILHQQNIKYVLDSTNLQTNYTRNFLRNKILPLFKNINLNYEKNILSTIEILNQTNSFISDFIEEKIKDSVKRNNSYVCIDLNKFLMYNDFTKKEILYRVLSKFVLKKEISLKQGYKKIVEKILSFLEDKKNLLDINKNLKLKKLNKRLYLIMKR